MCAYSRPVQRTKLQIIVQSYSSLWLWAARGDGGFGESVGGVGGRCLEVEQCSHERGGWQLERVTTLVLVAIETHRLFKLHDRMLFVCTFI